MSYDLWGRLRYMLSPQFDIYEQVSKMVVGSVADIGCGTGFGTHLLSRNADFVTGYEIDPMAMEFAVRAFSNGNISFVKADITEGCIKKGFDFVVMIDVIEHIRHAKLAIANCKTILFTGGAFICSTPNRLSRYRKSEYHVREYSPKELKDLLSGAFDTVNIVDYQLRPTESVYSNPIIAICS
jgi:2-polyprenyl-3-methyl-5-hydroxy-6-metoxy-1,4-benzoquinol methylase